MKAVVIIILLICCMLSSSGGGGYWTGYIPGTYLNKVRKLNEVVVEYDESGECDKKKLMTQVEEIGTLERPPDYLKDHALLKELKENAKKLGTKCGFDAI